MPMSLSKFVELVKTDLVQFELYWRDQHEKDPEAFPIEMDEGNEGLWWEQFQTFDASEDFAVEDSDLWIPMAQETPDVGEIVVFKSFDVAIGVMGKYTSDPWCGWINENGTFSRWPHKNFNPTHFKRI